MNEWIPVFAAFTGALVAGLISYRAAAIKMNKEDKAEKRTFILGKLEETHEVARTIRISYRKTYGDTVKLLMTNEHETRGDSLVEIDRLFMLVGFYFSELLPAIEILEKSRVQFGAILADSIVAVTIPDTPRQPLLDSLHQQYRQLDMAFDEFLKAITNLSHKYLKSWGIVLK
jgi:hypothetical protein